mgnify:CR=1 FL=1
MTTHWDSYAACRGMDAELWFPNSYTSPTGRYQADQAISICLACPVRRECLDEALAAEGGLVADRRNGILAGYTPTDRYNIHRQLVRRRAREQASA